MNILIIGMGSLGIRHIQSLKKTLPSANFFLVEKRSFEVVVKEFEKLGWATADFFNGILWYKNINELPTTNYDFIVISTTADNRGSILLEISKHLKFKNIIIEKPITNNWIDLQHFENIKNKNIFVNYTRRYQKLHQLLSNLDLKPRKIRFHSFNMGLLCNFTHYVDFTRMLIGDKYKVTNVHSKFTNIFESKRKGYFEVNGVIKLNFSNNCILEILDTKQNIFGNNWGFEIFTNDEKYLLDETKQYLSGPNIKHKSTLRLQSDLTGQYFNDIQKGVCRLPKINIPLQDFKLIFPKVTSSIENLLKKSKLKMPHRKGYFT